MSPPEKNRKRKTKSTMKKQSLTPIPSLPGELLLSIIARVSRLYYPTLSLVSKTFRSLLASPELYKARSLLGHTESCLYLCVKMNHSCSWFTLCRKPNQTLINETSEKKKKKSGGYVLAKVPIPNSHDANFPSLVAVGSNIYNIGVSESMHKALSSTVSVLDCTSHTWCKAPSLRVKPFTLSASVFDGNIYVAGTHVDANDLYCLKNSFEVFDTRTQAWVPEPIPYSVVKDRIFSQSACIDGNINVVAGSTLVAYNPKEGSWDMVPGQGMIDYIFSDSRCEIENVLYCYSHGAIKWYDSESRRWNNLEGLVGLPKFSPHGWVGLVDYGGKMAVLWEQDSINGYSFLHKKLIWCAEISLERRKNCEIWGKVEWFEHVLRVSMSSKLGKVLAVTV